MNIIAIIYFATLLTVVLLILFVVENLTTKDSIAVCLKHAIQTMVVGGILAFMVVALIYVWHVGIDLPVSGWMPIKGDL